MEQKTSDGFCLMDDCLEVLKKVVLRIGEVDDIDGQKGTPRQDQSQAAVAEIRAMVHDYAIRHGICDERDDADAEEAPKPEPRQVPGSAVTVGPGPYRALLISSAGGTRLYMSEAEFDTEAAAIDDAIAAARRHGWNVDMNVTNHWIRGDAHFVDFGSHEVYACIVPTKE